ncbi:hypothetical protein G3N58_17880 [Paraburkholderia sp. Ac-20342]|uniref:hypothetical protein n=1 Tax=Paraburkholderia sp. Ac-20342 TaxID=2703889 RepID=UPI001981C7D2|nr:hypothetical protein [Paraburkholderia sp. Ac-20342]MBN3848679.1 hypothetical protein [Paraburkholderia sp. Ac-20342]
MKQILRRLICWWSGCRPSKHAYFDCEYDGWITPCTRCSAADVSYADLVGETRHRRLVEFCQHWLLFGWVPRRCRDCKQWPSKCDCPPF